MDISIEAFRASVQDGGNGGYIRESRSHAGSISQYGNRVWETSRNFATSAESANIREKFFKALSGYGVEGEALASIRRQLGLDERGRAVDREHAVSLSRVEVRQILREADAYMESRAEFAKELSREGYTDPDLVAFINGQLGLADPAMARERFTEDERAQFRQTLKDEGNRLLANKKEELGFPGRERLQALLPNPARCDYIMTRLRNMEETGKYNADALNILKKSVNYDIMVAREDAWKERLAEKLQTLEAELPGCLEMKDWMFEKLMKVVDRELLSFVTVIQNIDDLDAIFVEKLDVLCQETVAKVRQLLVQVDSMEPPFSEAQKAIMKKIVLASPKIQNSRLIDIYSRYRDITLPLLEISLAHELTMTDFVKAYGTVQYAFDKCHNDMCAAVEDLGAEDTAVIQAQMFELGMAGFREKHNQDFEASVMMKKFMARFKGEMEYLQNHSADGRAKENQYEYRNDDAVIVGALQYNSINAYAACLGIAELNPPEYISGLSQPVADFLGDRGIKTRNSHNRPFDQLLGTKFQSQFLQELNDGVRRAGEGDGPQKLVTETTLQDLTRASTSWKLGGQYISRLYNTDDNGMLDGIMRYFAQDDAHGRDAMTALGHCLNQQFIGKIDKVRLEMGGVPFGDVFVSQVATRNEFEVERNADGSYDVKCSIFAQWSTALENGGSTQKSLDGVKSRQQYDFHLKLSFGEDGSPSFAFAESPTLKGGIYDSPLTVQESTTLAALVDPQTGENVGANALYDDDLLNNSNVRELLKHNDTAALAAFLKGKTITDTDEDYLFAMGMPTCLVKNLICRAMPTEKHLSKELVNRLLSPSGAVRDLAVAELKELCRPYIDRGLLEDFEIHPEMALMARNGRVKVESKKMSDFMLLRNAILNSEAEEIRRLPLTLAFGKSGDVMNGRKQLRQLLVEARVAAGVEWLSVISNPCSFTKEELAALREAEDQEAVKRHLRHVCAQDEFATSSAQALKVYSNTLVIERKTREYGLAEDKMERLATELKDVFEDAASAAKVRKCRDDFNAIKASGKYNGRRLAQIRDELNHAIAQMRMHTWGNLVNRLASEWMAQNQPDADAYGLAAELFKELQKFIARRTAELPKVMEAPMELDADVEEMCRNYLAARQQNR